MAAESEHSGIESYVLGPGQIHVRARSQLEQGGDPLLHHDPSGRRRTEAANQTQQRTLACAVTADDCDALSALHVEGHVLERIKRLKVALHAVVKMTAR